MRPNISYAYTPSFEKYFDTYAIDASGLTTAEYTKFDGGLFGAPGKNFSNNVGIALSNTFEAKIVDKESKKGESKKIMLINNLNFATNYDITADSLAWTPMRVSGGTLLFKDKLNLNFGATLDPYAIDNAGQRINTFNIENGGSLFRMTSANLTINYEFSSTDGEKQSNQQNLQNLSLIHI